MASSEVGAGNLSSTLVTGLPSTSQSMPHSGSHVGFLMTYTVMLFFVGMAAFTALVVLIVAVFGCIRIWCGRRRSRTAKTQPKPPPPIRSFEQQAKDMHLEAGSTTPTTQHRATDVSSMTPSPPLSIESSSRGPIKNHQNQQMSTIPSTTTSSNRTPNGSSRSSTADMKFRKSQATAPETRTSMVYPTQLQPNVMISWEKSMGKEDDVSLSEQDKNINDFVINQLDQQMLARFSQATIVEMGQTRL